MELKPGYKMTEVGIVPEDWISFELGKCGSLQRQAIIPSSYPHQVFYEYSMPAFDDGKNPIKVYGKDILSNKTIIRGQLILFNKLNVRQKRVWLINNTNKNSICSTEFLPYKTKKIIISLLKQILLTDKVTLYFENRSTGTSNSQKRITPNTFLEFKCYLPLSLTEQQAIAAALSDVDELLSSLDRLIAKKKDIRLATMQELLTGKKRLPGFDEPWSEKLFGELFEFLPTNAYTRAQFTDEGTINNIHYGDILMMYENYIDVNKSTLPFINESLSNKLYTKKSFVMNGDIVIANTAEDYTVGKAVEVINVNRKILSGQHTFLCRPKIEFIKKFLGYIINAYYFQNQINTYIT